MLDRDQLLAIHRPVLLFPGNAKEARRTYHTLSKVWHPDHPAGSHEVMSHITSLYQQALRKIADGLWEGATVVSIHEETITYDLHTRTSYPFLFGHTLICDNSVVYLYDAKYVEEWAWHANIAKTFHYASPKMQEEFERYLPRVARTGSMKDGRHVLQLHKTPDLICLRDVVTHCSKLDPKHVAWIVSSLLNLACYLSYTNMVHHEISPDTYFISPELHSGALLGGWSFACPTNDPVTHVSKRTYDVMPFAAKRTKLAMHLTDLELIRLTARECLAGTAPEPMQTWVHAVSTGSAVEQYKEWSEILKRTFGPRRFVRMAVNADDVYGRTVLHG